MVRFLLGVLLVAEFICMLGMARVNAVMERRLAEGEPMSFEFTEGWTIEQGE